MSRIPKSKELINTKLANSYGGWIYCEGCNKTIGYLCYVTYEIIRFNYKCKCGSAGSMFISFSDENMIHFNDEKLISIKNRLCCPSDKSPLLTILSKNLETYDVRIKCFACSTNYLEEQSL